MARREEMDTYGNRTYGMRGAVPGGSRSRGSLGSGPFSGARSSGGFGAPIMPPGGGRSRGESGFVNQQDATQSASPYNTPGDITNSLNGTPPAVPTPRPAPTSAQTAENPGQYAGTSFDPQRNIRNMNEVSWTQFPTELASSSPEGSGFNANGEYGYVASNGSLDTSRFTPAPAPQNSPLSDYDQAEADVQRLTKQLLPKYQELTFANYMSGNPNRGGFSIHDAPTQQHYANAWGRPLNTALLNNSALQQAAGTAGYDPFAIRAALQQYV